MKKLLFIAFVFCTTTYVHAQNKIKYSYDSAGNRTKREIVLSATRSILSEENEQVPYIEEMQSHEIKIYPNPTKGILNIKITGLDKAKGFISIYNIVGKLIEKTELSDNNQTFDLSAQPNGIYIMQIRIEDKISSWKIIKE